MLGRGVRMAFNEEFLSELRSRCNIEDVVGRYVDLKRRSGNCVGLCPFHSEKTPSFSVNTAKQFFYCFGCHAGGDVITFIMKIENLSYAEAVRFLADSVGLAVPEQTSFDSEKADRMKRLYEVNKEAARFFHEKLRSPEGKPGLDYLIKRGVTPQTLVRFGLGFAPDSWDSLIRYMTGKGYTKEELKATGLVIAGKKNDFDCFRNRVMFPIIDYRDRVIGFGGRAIDGKEPKYLNSPENSVFRKRYNLYALNKARTVKEPLILCEGYMDVVALHQAGFGSTVASLGTSLTPEQARLMKRYNDRVIICYDGDAPGRNAAEKAIGLLKAAGLEVKVITIPGNMDPDDFIKADPENGKQRFRQLLESSPKDLDYRLDNIRFKYNMDIDNEKLQAVREMLTVLAGSTDRVEQEIYIGKISRETGLSKENLTAELTSAMRRRQKAENKKEDRESLDRLRGRGDAVNPQKSKYLRAASAEEDLISVLLNFPEKLETIKEKIGPEDFVTDFNRHIFELLCEKIPEQPDEEPQMAVSPYLTPDEMSKITALIANIGVQSVSDAKINSITEILKEEKEKLLFSAVDGNLSDENFGKRMAELRSRKGN